MRGKTLQLIAGLALACGAAFLSGCGGGGGGSDSPAVVQPPPPPPPTGPTDQPLNDPTIYSSASSASLGVATEAAAITHQQVVVAGATLRYTTTTGHLVARDLTTAQPQASFFYVAYTADGQDAAQRPVTFFYNGGPGSASVWLHLGSYGPRRLATGLPSTAAPMP